VYLEKWAQVTTIEISVTGPLKKIANSSGCALFQVCWMGQAVEGPAWTVVIQIDHCHDDGKAMANVYG
jgi:hypothetical protein